MINFRTIELTDKNLYNKHVYHDISRGCQYSFSNLFMWGLQEIAYLDDHVVLYSHFDNQSFYPFPVGSGNKKDVLDAIFTDAKERNICPYLTGLNETDTQTLEKLYPNQFYFHADRNNFDYVYDINDLADLKGRKLHRKRNHLKHFRKNHPNYVMTPITLENMDRVRAFVTDWYKQKQAENPDGDYRHEKAAIEKVFTHYNALEMDGLILEEHDKILGFTMASQMSPDTYDVHYEKARGDIDGAYTTINSEFANYIRNKYPHIKYLDREEDMGIPGLRKAKMSYFPHHLVKKYKAIPLQVSYHFEVPTNNMVPQLRDLWKESFGDNDTFLNNFYSTAFDFSRCRIATVHDELAAVLYWFDCSLDNQRIAYVYAVATAKNFRGRGACHMLLKDTHKYLKALGYSGVVLVPGNESLIHLYEGCEYELCTKRSRIDCTSEEMGVKIREIDKDEYATLRREFLPKNSVIQENENLDFLVTQTRFYTGSLCDSTFLLAGYIEKDNLYGMELLGDATLAPGIVHALGCKDGTFFTPGKDEPFAMWHGLTMDAVVPSYFGFAFD